MSPFILAILVILLGSFICSLCAASFRPRRQRKNDPQLPPGPPALPIIGNLHMLGKLPHRSLHQLAKKYGPIMSMRLGSVPAIVVSSPQAAELFLKTHDLLFASRPMLQASLYMSYGNKGVVFSEYGPYWRSVRKLCTLQLLSASKIEYFAPMRREEVGLLVDSLKKAAAAREVVDISLAVGDLIQNMTCRMVFGEAKNSEFDLKPLAKEALNLAGAFNIADCVPFLGAFDLQGLTKRMKSFSKAMDTILEKIICEHEREARWKKKQQMKDFVDVLLSLMNQPMTSNEEEETIIDGYHIPKNARIIVNAWAIGRDPNAWSDNAEEFLPERFADTSIDLRGHDFQLLPFGSGRRGCPGMQLGLTITRFVLAQLVHCFNWELPDGVLPNELDMSEIFGLSMPRANHLVAVPKYRLRV
ncbi:hypothetical protein GH714_027631 [Hevea brasiliensis]|uniref:Cytochrome P450 n=1 Tax=Hevea brasiliensis TaxID=3981 RepID=A0A6A6LFK3_HEVBR|nr:hypothetical protein GH714_027631 [Hevea brasiliensis]